MNVSSIPASPPVTPPASPPTPPTAQASTDNTDAGAAQPQAPAPLPPGQGTRINQLV
jgi:hypothetical protein